jgi:hypothetical protein
VKTTPKATFITNALIGTTSTSFSIFTDTQCPKSRESQKKRKEKIKILMTKEIKMTPSPSEIEGPIRILTVKTTKPKFSPKTESQLTYLRRKISNKSSHKNTPKETCFLRLITVLSKIKMLVKNKKAVSLRK